MKVYTPIIILFLISCSNIKEDQSIDKEIKEIVKIEKIEEINSSSEILESQEKKILEIIDTVFNLDSIDLENPKNHIKSSFYEHIDSSNVIDFKKYLTFNILEFNTETNANNEFKKIKSIVDSIKSNPRLGSHYHRFILKSGVTFIYFDNYILSHNLRCNMEPIDYEKDMNFINNIELLHSNTKWLRIKCGWCKFETNF